MIGGAGVAKICILKRAVVAKCLKKASSSHLGLRPIQAGEKIDNNGKTPKLC